jgi:hypothetical protein
LTERRLRGDDGTGVLSASIGLTFFLVFLLFATAVAANLFATSGLRSDASHATHAVASDRVQRGGEAAVQAEIQRQTDLLNTRYQKGHPQITWSQDDDWLVLKVIVESPSKLAAPARNVLHLDEISASSRVRLERPR